MATAALLHEENEIERRSMILFIGEQLASSYIPRSASLYRYIHSYSFLFFRLGVATYCLLQTTIL